MEQHQPNPQLFFDTINAYQRTAALKTAIEIDLFSAIAAGHDTPASIAAATGAAERGARILADYLVVIGFLAKSSAGRYACTPDTAFLLDRRSPAYLGGATEFLVSHHLRGSYDDLTAAVRQGGARRDAADSVLAPDHDAWVRFARGMAPLMAMPAEMLARHVLEGAPAAAPSGEIRVLDVAAGHGMFGIAVARHHPRATIVASDWAPVLDVARENARRAGVLDRYQTLPGSAFDVDWGTGYDVVLLTNFLHHFSPAENAPLLQKVRRSLKPGGRAVTLEFVPNADRVTPPPAATFSLTMLATTPAGDAYTFAELDQMFRAAGFSNCSCKNLDPTMEQVVTAW